MTICPRRTSGRHRLSALVFLAMFMLAGIAQAAAQLPDFERLVDEQGASVVNIRTRMEAKPGPTGLEGNPGNLPEFLQRFYNFRVPPQMQPPQPAAGLGSGVIASSYGYILTNAHVVDGANTITVQLNDRREFEARLVGIDTHTDIAVIKIDARGLSAARFGDSDKLNVGQWVLAIGAPFGLNETATQGIVSAVSRSLPNDTYVPFIQTDVALNPGNSGGPLFNLDGEVIGINSQIFSRTGGYMGLSFAIPSNLAINIAEKLKTDGHIARGWLGISIQDLDQSLAESFGLPGPEGALVSAVTPDSPAARAALRPGDVILEFDGKAIDHSAALPPIVADTTANATTKMRVWRDGKAREMTITVGLLPGTDAVAQSAPQSGPLGLLVSDLTQDDRKARGVSAGVRVDRVEPGKPGAYAGLESDDIIVSFNHEEIDNVAELASLSRDAAPGQTVPVLVQRDDQIRFLALKIPPRQTG